MAMVGVLVWAGGLPCQVCAEPQKTGKEDRPVATIYGVAIPRGLWERKIQRLNASSPLWKEGMSPEQVVRMKNMLVNTLIEDELIRREIKKHSITISKADFVQQLEAYKKLMTRGGLSFEESLVNAGLTMESLEDRITLQIGLKKLMEKSGKGHVLAQEIQDYYKRNKRRYSQGEMVKASHILIKVEKNADRATEQDAKARTEEIYRKAIRNPQDFAALAKDKSEGPSAPRGGDLGWFTRGRMVAPFEKASFALKVHQISKPVRTQFGWHIIQCNGHKPAVQKTYAEVKDEIHQILLDKKVSQERRRIIDALKSKSEIKVLIEFDEFGERTGVQGESSGK